MRAKKLNLLALARADKPLMSSFQPSPGNIFVSCDLSAGEPTVICHYSRDKNYYDATFGMVGKRPFYDDAGLLKIDDIYLTGMSFSPMYKDKMFELFHTSFEGLPFPDLWVKDPDFCKNLVKAERKLTKIKILGLGYGMGAKKLSKTAYDAGYDNVSPKIANAFKKAYWEWCRDVYKLSKYLEQQFLETGYVVNEFGYRSKPDKSFKAMNYLIQSSVSGIMHVLLYKFFAICNFAEYVACIHDEVIFEIPENRAEGAKVLFESAVKSLNADLGWSVEMRCGWAAGRNLYESK